MYLDLDTLKLSKSKEVGRVIPWSEVSRETGIRRPTLYAYKNVDRNKRVKALNIQHLIALLNYFGCEVEELVKRDETIRPSMGYDNELDAIFCLECNGVEAMSGRIDHAAGCVYRKGE